MWYKQSQKEPPPMFDKEEVFRINDFADRNLINEKIRSLQSMSDTLMYCAQLVFQTQRGARSVVSQIRNSKKLSSFTNIITILDKADKLALDSPYQFGELCKAASLEIDIRVDKLIQIRKDFAKNDYDPTKPQKGLF